MKVAQVIVSLVGVYLVVRVKDSGVQKVLFFPALTHLWQTQVLLVEKASEKRRSR
jgi:hypothetical protein